MHLGYYDNPEHTPGAFTTKLASDTTKINGIALSMVGISVQTIITLIVGVVLGFVYDWRLALINLGFMPIIVVTAALQWKLQQGFSESDEYSEIQAGSILSESVCNTKTIFSYNMESKVVEMYNSILKSKEKTILKTAFVNGVLFGLSQLSMFATYAALFYAGASFINSGTLTLGNMLRSIFSILFASFGLGQAQQYVGDISKAKEALVNIYRTLDETSTIDPLDDKNELLKKPEVIKGKIEFKDVCFSYPSRPKELIFDNLNFTILPGQKTAFVGLSGSGKSTVIQLLSRFYDVTSGSILIDDIDIKDYDIISLRKLVGLVMQEPVLFATNFRSNVKYGKLNANDDEIDFSSGKAKITKFIEPIAFKNSITVSGGEKQRIAIARTFLKDPKILLLDEATSALDEQNEKLVQKALDHIMDGRTSITIAHR
jgi:ATP-binding cassette subfamily B (MDR/TAP) protein 1